MTHPGAEQRISTRDPPRQALANAATSVIHPPFGPAFEGWPLRGHVKLLFDIEHVQAADRAHRIGQEKPVFVYRLKTLGMVEEKTQELQAKKRDLV